MLIRIATRRSRLAVIQTDLVIKKLKNFFPHINCEIVPVITTGDRITDKNLYDIGGKALFLKELEEKLLTGEVDLAIHSLKDVPGILPVGLEIAAVLEREDPRDCLVSYKYKSLNELPNGAIIGTSSVRRKVILQKIRPYLKIIPCRGNIQTRLDKLSSDNAPDAIILACGGLKRLGIFDEKHCFIIFGSWAFTSDVINLTTNSVQLDQYVRNGEWNLISTKQTVKLITFQGQNGSYSLLYIDLYFRRRTLFYTFNFILPNLILDLLTCFSFMLPPERGEKVGVCK